MESACFKIFVPQQQQRGSFISRRRGGNLLEYLELYALYLEPI